MPTVQVWDDKRAAEIVTAFEAEHSPTDTFRVVGNYPTTAWQGFKIKWIQPQQPGIYVKAWKISTVSSLIVFKLTRVLAIRYAEASGTYCMDSCREVWSDDLIRVLGIDSDHLPEIAPATSIARHITPETARVTGLQDGTPVAVGAVDFLTAALSASMTKPGDAAAISGTSCLMAVVAQDALMDPRLMNLRQKSIDARE